MVTDRARSAHSAAAMKPLAFLLLASLAAAVQGSRPSGAAVPVYSVPILAIEDARVPTAADLQWLITLARDEGPGPPAPLDSRMLAIRTLGRLERADLIPVLANLLSLPGTRHAAEVALVVTLRAQPVEASATDAFRQALAAALAATTSPTVLAYLPYTAADQVALAESKLLGLAQDPRRYPGVTAGLEALVRQHRSKHAPSDQAIALLRRGARRSLPAMDATDAFVARTALAALSAAGAVEQDDLRAALRDGDEHVRRQAVVALNVGTAAVDQGVRTELLRTALLDRSFIVRFEAVRGWSRHAAATQGCDPLVAALADPDVHVAVAAAGALGGRCQEDEGITERLAAEATTPPATGGWHRQAHALVSLAQRAAERAATLLPGFARHGRPQVRTSAARAAYAMKDAATLEQLALDEDDNVREAALGPFRSLSGSASDGAVIAALGRRDYQLLRTAALLLKEASPDPHLRRALAVAFERVTAEKKDTARDTRLALLERIVEWGGRDQLPLYERLTRDFDPAVARTAAAACSTFSGRPCAAVPRLEPRPPVPTAGELSEQAAAIVELDTGRRFEIQLSRDLAPLACARFSRLVRRGYYDGLTFHRVEPGFVIQGGSPGGNEYAGDGPFMRDELGGSHRRGTVGISTRGRHTGDAQIFVNLADNLRLDFAYTVMGTISESDMAAVDGVVEGTTIRRIRLIAARRHGGGR